MGKLYKFYYAKDSSMVMNLMNLYINSNMTNKEALAYVENKDNYKKFKEFLVIDYISYKVFEIIPTLIKKCKDEYMDDELDEDFQEIKINDNTNNLKQENDGKVFTRQDFADSDEEFYSDEDANNHKQIVKRKHIAHKKSTEKNYNNSNELVSPNYNKFNEKNLKNEWEFPVRLGSFQNFSNVALEYIKILCEVLAIDPDISDLAYKIKKNSLKLINIEEFSKETEFIDPCRTFVLHDVVCELCSSNKDFDFCRDSSILENDWKCELCNTTYDRYYIEFLIIQKVKSLIDYYFNQDLKCKKCLMQKNELIFIRCECAGEFLKTYEDNFLKKSSSNNIKTMEEFLDVILNISNYFRFENLKAMLEQVARSHL